MCVCVQVSADAAGVALSPAARRGAGAECGVGDHSRGGRLAAHVVARQTSSPRRVLLARETLTWLHGSSNNNDNGDGRLTAQVSWLGLRK